MKDHPLIAVPVSKDTYLPFGDLLSLDSDSASRSANQGSARRIDYAARLENQRAHAKPNLSLFRCAPRPLPFRVEMLERHAFSTQVFLPLSGARFVVVVAEGGVDPDPATLRAFLVEGATGISYRAGVWHHPMIALDRETDFSCLVWEDGSAGDCEEVKLDEPRLLVVS